MVNISRVSKLQIETDDKELDWLITILSEKIYQLDTEGECIIARRLEKVVNDITRQARMENKFCSRMFLYWYLI